MRRRHALVTALAAAAAAVVLTRRDTRPPEDPWRRLARVHLPQFEPARLPPPTPLEVVWRLVTERVFAGGPNRRLGLVQAQHIFARAGSGFRLVRSGLVRVRVPTSLIRQGDDGWHPNQFEDGWWMERLRDLRVPFKAVVELGPRFTDEQHAAHAARVAQRVRPDVVIIGNELNAIEARPEVDVAAEIERYLDRYDVMHAAIRAASPATRIQLYGEAYYGEPTDRNAFLRPVLAAMRRRGLPPPDLAGIHVYDGADIIPKRVTGYRRLLADFGLHIPVSVEELGPRQGVVDEYETRRLLQQPAEDDEQFPHRLAELYAHGWLTEAEHAELVAQHLATAAASADQAQIFCAHDVPTELQWRRGLVSGVFDRARPALGAFRFLQRLLNDLAEVHLRPAAEQGGVATVSLIRRDGLAAHIHWSAPVGEEVIAPARTLPVPPATFVCDARGQLVAAPYPNASTLELPAATSQEAGGAVRILI